MIINLVFLKSSVLKGINNDLKIFESVLKDIGVKTKKIFIHSSEIRRYANIRSRFPLVNKIYVFSEILLPELFAYLLNKNKKIIIVPNIDSYSSYRKDYTFFYYMKKFSKLTKKFIVLSKTKQIQRWLNKYNIKNHYINFCYYKSKYNETKELNIKNNILLDTGGSLGGRKYCNKIINILKDDKNFNLVVKTLPAVYKKNRMKKFKNIKIITKKMTEEELDNFYDSFNFSIYLSKYDGYGLSLGKAIMAKHFIFCNDGFPWNEILQRYPRKCLIKCEKIGKVRSQHKYKTKFNDLKNKIKDYEKYINVIKNTIKEVDKHNIENNLKFREDMKKILSIFS
jgi:hypothetical protein